MDILSMCGLVDTSTRRGLIIQGGSAASEGVKREDNPYSVSHPRSLAEKEWAEGWDSYTAWKTNQAQA